MIHLRIPGKLTGCACQEKYERMESPNISQIRAKHGIFEQPLRRNNDFGNKINYKIGDSTPPLKNVNALPNRYTYIGNVLTYYILTSC